MRRNAVRGWSFLPSYAAVRMGPFWRHTRESIESF
jgi:hypothetical protein